MGVKRQESDSSVLLRDGRTDHMGKGRAGQSNEQSTHAKGRNVLMKSVSSTLLELREKAEREPKHGDVPEIVKTRWRLVRSLWLLVSV